jgi:broad specificity phosphatase PhoE
MTLILLVRHGETEWNQVERFRGRTDIELNGKGQRQAEALAERLANWQIEAIYSSPLKRAVETARPIGGACGLAVESLPALTDVEYGAWTGQSPTQVEAEHGELYQAWLTTPHLICFPGGESLDDVRSRAMHALEDIRLQHADQTVVVVSHLVVIRVLVCAVLGLDNSAFWNIAQDTAAINMIEASEGRSRLLLLNDTCHLMFGGPASSPWTRIAI